MNDKIKLYRLTNREANPESLVPIGQFDDLNIAEERIKEICKTVDGYLRHSLVAPVLINYPNLSIAGIQAKIHKQDGEIEFIDFGIRLERT